MKKRCFAFIGQQEAQHKIIHYWVRGEGREMMPWPRVVIIDAEETAMMYRYAADGTFAGDTWHQSFEDAQAQADYEYAGALGEWQEIPPDIDNPIEFVKQQAQKEQR